MLRKITKTYDEITVKAVALNLATLEVTEPEIKLENYSKTKKIDTQVSELLEKQGLVLSEVLEKTVFKGTYWMTENEFFQNAEVAKERPQGNYIARTLAFSEITAVEINMDKEGKRTARERKYLVLGEHDTKTALKAVKSKETANKKIPAVKAVKKVEKLYVMTDEKFRSLSYNEEKAGE